MTFYEQCNNQCSLHFNTIWKYVKIIINRQVFLLMSVGLCWGLDLALAKHRCSLPSVLLHPNKVSNKKCPSSSLFPESTFLVAVVVSSLAVQLLLAPSTAALCPLFSFVLLPSPLIRWPKHLHLSEEWGLLGSVVCAVAILLGCSQAWRGSPW